MREMGRLLCLHGNAILVKTEDKTRSSCVGTRRGERAAEIVTQYPVGLVDVSSAFLAMKFAHQLQITISQVLSGRQGFQPFFGYPLPLRSSRR